MYLKPIKKWFENDCPREKFMDIKVLAHIIITDQSYFSFADQGLI